MIEKAGRIACVVLLWALPARAGLLSVPAEYTPEKSWPVVVSLQDNPSPELMKATPYFLVHAGGQSFEATKNIRENLLALARRYNIDPFRIYGTGFSRGGQEVLIQAWRHPDWFAAVAPACSDLREKPDRNNRHLNVRYLANVPTLLLHGEGDSFRQSGQIEYDLMKEAACPVEWKTYPGGHTPEQPFRRDVRLLTDFFQRHRLDPYPRKVVHVVEHKSCSRAFWADCELVRDAADMRAVFTVEVKEGNRIEVQAGEEIAALELYLTDKLVDMKRPVTVLAGGKTLYQGPPEGKVTVPLRQAQPYERVPQRPLWEELAEIRRQAAATQATRPAGSTQPR